MTQNDDFLQIWERIEKETDVTTFLKLAELVETTHQYVSRKKKKNEFPVEWAFKVAQKYDLSTDWIMTGKEPERLKETRNNFSFYEDLELWARETGGSKNTDWLKNQIESFFPMFKKWKEEKEESEEAKNNAPAYKVA